ncbi:class II glutamine amidotransferase [Nocardia veterana]|uniref:Gamma-glutamyl-hercynylcysteine sulfoxide hydrolase n=1 Tax=Nocardia veterana TaxID=132249 RepID=A0A7X6M1N1_9NOCA|nr:class II glutamine amidotransferase [Nocardia veterana]NKY88644.1 class II glutamine amidotransferase [Nocardia veterana]
MCRHLGYLGPPAPVGELLTRGTHSLRTQSWAPTDMRRGGTVNADGFGVAWWVPTLLEQADGEGPSDGRVAGRIGGRAPVTLLASRYRNPAPIWTDPAVDEVLPQLRSTAVLGAVRSATVGMPVERSACAPFTDGRWAFSHNGVVQNWRTVLPAVARQFGSPDLLAAESATDSATLWVVLRAALAGAEHDSAVAEVLAATVRAVLADAPNARLNLLLGDGETLWATTVYHSLSVLVTDDFAVISSEPYDDDPRWRSIPDRQVLTVRPGHLVVEPLAAVPHPGPDESERARS